MKLTIPRNALATAVTSASRALPQRPPAPVLAGLVLHATGTQLTISAYDYETSMDVVTTAATIGEPGRVLVPGRLLADIARSLPASDVTLHTEGPRVIVEARSTRFSLNTLPLDEYPELPKAPPSIATMNASELAAAVAKAAVACSTEDSLPVLTGVQLTLQGGKAVITATDRYRFAAITLPYDALSTQTAATALIPGRDLLEIAKTLPETGDVSIALPDKSGTIGITADHLRATTRCLEGALPQHRTLIPSDFPTTITIDTADLAAAVKRVALVLERSSPITLAFLGSAVTITGGADQDARAEERIPCHVDGDPVTISFNPRFLLDGLTVIDAEQAQIGITGPSKPALLTPTRDSATTPAGHSEYLIMPIRRSA